MAYALNAIVDARHRTQAAAAARLGFNEPKVSALRNDRLEGFSVERLITPLNALDQDIEIVIRARPRVSVWWRGDVGRLYPSPAGGGWPRAPASGRLGWTALPGAFGTPIDG